jgi:hypothetical protein
MVGHEIVARLDFSDPIEHKPVDRLVVVECLFKQHEYKRGIIWLAQKQNLSTNK